MYAVLYYTHRHGGMYKRYIDDCLKYCIHTTVHVVSSYCSALPTRHTLKKCFHCNVYLCHQYKNLHHDFPYDIHHLLQAHEDFFEDEHQKHQIKSISVYISRPTSYKRKRCQTLQEEYYAMCCEGCYALACSQCENSGCTEKQGNVLW